MPLGQGDMLGGLDALAGGGIPLDDVFGGDTIRCQVCASDLDPVTGAPLGPVGPENVAAVKQYELGAGQAELGGTALDLGLPGMAF